MASQSARILLWTWLAPTRSPIVSRIEQRSPVSDMMNFADAAARRFWSASSVRSPSIWVRAAINPAKVEKETCRDEKAREHPPRSLVEVQILGVEEGRGTQRVADHRRLVTIGVEHRLPVLVPGHGESMPRPLLRVARCDLGI